MLKIHCLGVGEHRGRPLCGEDEKLIAMSRQEFMTVSKEKRCGRCANAAWVRGELRVRKYRNFSVTGGAAAASMNHSSGLPATSDIK